MPAFRRVEVRQAGRTALGVLIPPGASTLVIVRPRALDWDLLPAHWNGDMHSPPRFCSFTRDEAAAAARRLHHFLEDAVARGSSPILVCESPGGAQFQVWLRTDEHVWILCARTPGHAYTPLVFSSCTAAQQAGERVEAFLWPARDANQEIYFNTQLFSS